MKKHKIPQRKHQVRNKSKISENGDRHEGNLKVEWPHFFGKNKR